MEQRNLRGCLLRYALLPLPLSVCPVATKKTDSNLFIEPPYEQGHLAYCTDIRYCCLGAYLKGDCKCWKNTHGHNISWGLPQTIISATETFSGTKPPLIKATKTRSCHVTDITAIPTVTPAPWEGMETFQGDVCPKVPEGFPDWAIIVLAMLPIELLILYLLLSCVLWCLMNRIFPCFKHLFLSFTKLFKKFGKNRQKRPESRENSNQSWELASSTEAQDAGRAARLPAAPPPVATPHSTRESLSRAATLVEF
jgi:hypothetical protein